MKVPNLDFLAEELSALDAKQHKATRLAEYREKAGEMISWIATSEPGELSSDDIGCNAGDLYLEYRDVLGGRAND